MKTVTREVIVIAFSNGDFLFGMPYSDTIEYTQNIKHVDVYDTVDEAKKALDIFNKMSDHKASMGGSVKKFSYVVDEKFLQNASNIEEVKY